MITPLATEIRIATGMPTQGPMPKCTYSAAVV